MNKAILARKAIETLLITWGSLGAVNPPTSFDELQQRWPEILAGIIAALIRAALNYRKHRNDRSVPRRF